MVDDYLARLDTSGLAPGVTSLKPGSSVLALLEAVAQSQAKNSMDIMNLVDASNIDKAKGAFLDRIGRQEGINRLGETYATGRITISDSRYTKVSNRIYSGNGTSVSGSTTIYLSDASAFPNSGSVYLGRGSTRLEGPLAYTSRTQKSDGSWALTIPAGTTKQHQVGDAVVLAQGGDRQILAGQVIGTPQGNKTDSALYRVSQPAVILDGDVEVSNVPVTAQVSGAVGNVNAGAIRYVVSPPFIGMTCTNPLPVNNGTAIESDDHYRDRIKAIRGNRSKATPGALLANLYGVKSSSEDSVVASARLVERPGSTTTLYIDDGSAYEPKDAGVDQEVLVDQADGGETTFHLAYGRPTAKATLKSSNQPPYRLAEGNQLAILVGGVRYEHTFVAQDFQDITAATAYEVVASINANPTVGFSARTIGGGTGLGLQARQEANDDLELTQPLGVDAASVLGLPGGRYDTLRLYLNDKLLFKDGAAAKLTSLHQSEWAGIHTGDTLTISVDGTDQKTYQFLDKDFAAVSSTYPTVNTFAPLSVWAAVLNNKVAGCTARVEGASLTISSNLGRSDRAAISIDSSSSLVTKGMFSQSSLVSLGMGSDYVLDRQQGIIELSTALAVGDRLTCGSSYTRAYLESSDITTIVAGSSTTFYFALDGTTKSISTSLDGTHTLTLNAGTSNARRITATMTLGATAAYPFGSVQVGDWMFVTSDLFSTDLTTSHRTGCWRVSAVDPLGQWLEFDLTPINGSTITPANVGTAYRYISIYRLTSQPQTVVIPAGTYSPQDICDSISGQLSGGWATTYRESRYRVGTNSHSSEGAISLLAIVGSQTFGLSIGVASNDHIHTPSVTSGNSDIGTPNVMTDVILDGGVTLAGLMGWPYLRQGDHAGLVWAREYFDRLGSNVKDKTQLSGISSLSGTTTTSFQHLREGLLPGSTSTSTSRLFPAGGFRLGPESRLSLTLDKNAQQGSFQINMFRRLVPDPAVTYGSTLKMLDADNLDSIGNPQSLGMAFGSTFDFSNFMLLSRPRCQLDGVVWRTNKFWNGEAGVVRYSSQATAGQATAVSIVAPYDVTILTPTTGVTYSLNIGSMVRVHQTPTSILLMVGLNSMTLSRAVTTGIVTCTFNSYPSGITGHGLIVGQTIYLSPPSGYGFTAGAQVIDSVAGNVVTWVDSSTTAIAAVTDASAFLTLSSGSFDLTHSSTVGPSGRWLAICDQLVPGVSGARRVTAASNLSMTLARHTGDNLVDTSTGGSSWAAPIASSLSVVQANPINRSTLVSQVNALTGSPISGTLVGTDQAFQVEQSDEVSLAQTCQLLEGVLHISSSTYDGSNYTLTTKYPVSSSVQDWANEQYRLVPTTTKNIVDFLSVPSVTGLSLAGGNVAAANQAGKLQIGSEAAGSSGAIQVTGGTANELNLPVKGSAQIVWGPIDYKALISCPAGQDLDEGLSQGMPVAINSTISLPKSTGWTSGTTLAASAGQVTSSQSLWSASGGRNSHVPDFGMQLYFEKVGNFTCLTDVERTTLGFSSPSDVTTIPTGDWLTVLPSDGQWTTQATAVSGSIARFGAAVVRMADGKVMIVGGARRFTSAAPEGAVPVQYSNVDIYDPATKQLTATEAYPITVAWAAATLMLDGRVMVSGGINGSTATAHTYIYNPNAIGTKWASAPDMQGPRARHTLTTLWNGDIMALGGHDSNVIALFMADYTYWEIYQGSSWSYCQATQQLTPGTRDHQTIQVGLDQLYVIGGYSFGATGVVGDVLTSSISLGRKWTAAGSLQKPRMGHSCIQLPSGKILVVGGCNAAGVPMTETEIYDPTTKISRLTTGKLNFAQAYGTALLLANGKVAYMGGSKGAGELFDPATETWSMLTGATNPYSIVLANQDGTIQALGASPNPSDVSPVDITFQKRTFDRSKSGPNLGNQGTFRVVSSSQHCIWIENAESVDENVQANMIFRTYNSVMPGDTLRVSTPKLGASNQNDFTVSTIDFNDRTKVTVSGIGDFSSIALGTSYGLVQVLPSSPGRVIMKVALIAPDPTDPTLVSVYLVPMTPPTFSYYSFQYDNPVHFPAYAITQAAGCILSPLDKLAFPTDLLVGQDSYSYNTGLLAEVNRVVYGDVNDTSSYPGLVAAGQKLDIDAALIRRVRVELSVRVKPGANVKQLIQSAVAKVINGSKGMSIPISSIIDAASRVTGVVSVSMLSPTYNSSNDTLPVKQYESPRILDIDQDVKVVFVGQ
jgi:uncharacterized phage protein gp47/JayE